MRFDGDEMPADADEGEVSLGEFVPAAVQSVEFEVEVEARSRRIGAAGTGASGSRTSTTARRRLYDGVNRLLRATETPDQTRDREKGRGIIDPGPTPFGRATEVDPPGFDAIRQSIPPKQEDGPAVFCGRQGSPRGVTSWSGTDIWA